MKKCVFFPLRTPYTEPYCNNYRKAISPFFEMVDHHNIYSGNIRLQLLKKYSFVADVYILNWIESIESGIKGLFLFLYSMLFILIILIRGKKVVWMFHNIHPHEGENLYSRIIQKVLFRYATIILSHSKEAVSYAEKHACCPVLYFGHPVEIRKFTISKKDSCDVFIWGTILPYKGIPEFLELTKDLDLRIRIIGHCKLPALERRIVELCDDNIIFENRRPDFDEIASWCHASRYVIFPYIGDSISSSGALVDTISMGATPVGPNRGAFRDLAEDGVCVTYNDEVELMKILKNNIEITQGRRDSFFKKYSWNSFGIFVKQNLNGI